MSFSFLIFLDSKRLYNKVSTYILLQIWFKTYFKKLTALSLRALYPNTLYYSHRPSANYYYHTLRNRMIKDNKLDICTFCFARPPTNMHYYLCWSFYYHYFQNTISFHHQAFLLLFNYLSYQLNFDLYHLFAQIFYCFACLSRILRKVTFSNNEYGMNG